MVTRRQALLAGILGLMLAATGAWLAFGRHPARRAVQAGTRPLPIVTPAFPTPPAPVTAGWRIRSSDLKIDLPIVEGDGWSVGLDEAAHYPGMAWPGQGNRSLIYAHARVGMFGPRMAAYPGAHFEVDRPGQPPLHYVLRQYFPHWSPSDLTYTRPTNHEELVLLTCTTYSPNDPRIIAVAEPG